jgi:hypothetical protein
VTVDDSADPTGRAVSVTQNQITGLAPAPISYAGGLRALTVRGGRGGNTFTVSNPSHAGMPAALTLYGGGGDDTVNVQGNTAGAILRVNGEAGNDTITLGNLEGRLDGISNVQVNGGPGSNTLNMSDSNFGGSDTYQVTAATVSRPFSLGLITTYRNIGSLILTTGGGNDTIDLLSTASLVSCNLGNGNNLVRLSPAAGSLAALASPLILNGGTGNNTLTFFDQLNPWAESYAFTPTSLAAAFSGFLCNYSGFSTLVLWTNERSTWWGVPGGVLFYY